MIMKDKIWFEYMKINGGEFSRWWSKLTTKEKMLWEEKKEEIDEITYAFEKEKK